MKSVSADFINAINKTNSPGVEVQLWMSNFSKGESIADRTSYLDLASVGNIVEAIEKGLNEFKAGDVNLRVYNTSDFFINDTGTGLLELDDIIRIQLKFKFQGIADLITKFDGYLDRDSIRRKGENLIEFHCISWHKDLEDWDSETVADKENNPFKNITGLKWEYGHADHPVIIDNKGEMGVHILKHTKSGADHYWQYDSGDKVLGNSGWVTVWNEYKDAEGSLAQKEQEIRFKIIGSLPDDSQEDTIVVIWDYTQGFMVPAYWYENIHLVTAVNHLLDSVGRDEFNLDGVIDTREIKARDIELGTGSRIFSYYNSIASDKKCYSCIFMGDDWFVFNLDDEIRKVERTSNPTLSYDLIDTVSGGLKIYKMWEVGDDIWGIIGNSSTDITKIFKLTDWDTSPSITEYSINLYGGELWSVCVDIDITNKIIYYILRQSSSIIRGIKFDLTAETFTQLFFNPTPLLAGMCYKEGKLYFWMRIHPSINEGRLNIYDISGDVTTVKFPDWKPHIVTGSPILPIDLPMDSPYYYHIFTTQVETDSALIYLPESDAFSEFLYPEAGYMAYPDTKNPKGQIYGWNNSKTHIISWYGGWRYYTEDTFSYSPESPPCVFDEESGSFFGIAHNKTGDNFYIGWMFSTERNAFTERADFTDMTVRSALDDLAKAFMCNYKRGGYDKAFFYYREYARGAIYELTTAQYYNPPKIALWREQYDGVIVKGQDLQGEPLEWASGNIIGLKTRVLTIESRFLSDALGQTVAIWMHEFFKRKRRVFYVNLKFLLQLELQDEIKFKLPWDDATILYAFAYELEYQHDKHQIRAKLVELEGEETHPLTIWKVSHKLVSP